MSHQEFELKEPNTLLSSEFLNYPRLHDMGRLAISTVMPGEYDVSVVLWDRYERTGVINAYDDVSEASTSAEAYSGELGSKIDPLLLGIFCLEMHLRGIRLVQEVLDYEDAAKRQKELRPYRALFGNFYSVKHPRPDDMYVSVELPSNNIVQRLATTIPELLDSKKVVKDLF
ncbi:MAG TPA: hypothetical protein VFT59_01035 [Candidatus Saccharimonadales bacterium]|nr:hypothetical protein [Candidatus Saccharimonadales bacterium]